MVGYWNQPEETAAALRGGWMHTGDGGRMDDEGYVYVVDRIKDMIVSGGENVYSVEVENALAKHPDVASCAVIGVPDDEWGERVHAVVVPAAGATALRRCTPRARQGPDRGLQGAPHRRAPRRLADLRRGQDPQARAAEAALGRLGTPAPALGGPWSGCSTAGGSVAQALSRATSRVWALDEGWSAAAIGPRASCGPGSNGMPSRRPMTVAISRTGSPGPATAGRPPPG